MNIFQLHKFPVDFVSYSLSSNVLATNEKFSPRYVSGSGEDVALNLMIDVSRENYMAYVRSYHGVQIIIHGPTDFPETSISKAISQPGYENVVTIKPSVVVSDPDIRSLKLEQRGCFFFDEVCALYSNLHLNLKKKNILFLCKLHALIIFFSEKITCKRFV